MTHPHHGALRLRARIAAVSSGRDGDGIGAGDGYGDGREVVPSEGVNGGGCGTVQGAILHAAPLAPGRALERAQEGDARAVDGASGLADEQDELDVFAERVRVHTSQSPDSCRVRVACHQLTVTHPSITDRGTGAGGRCGATGAAVGWLPGPPRPRLLRG